MLCILFDTMVDRQENKKWLTRTMQKICDQYRKHLPLQSAGLATLILILFNLFSGIDNVPDLTSICLPRPTI